jgi:hypothetical protein
MATAAQCEGNPMPDTTDSRPPRISAGEKATLVEFLNYLRHAIVSNVEGPAEPQVRTAGVPRFDLLLMTPLMGCWRRTGRR